MKRLSPLIRRGSETDLDTAMTPMIDVVFLLLVFFVWTASFQIVEHILPSEMSELVGSDASENIEPPPPKDIEDIVVKIGWDGQIPTWRINDQNVPSLSAVGEKLKTISEIQVDATVILRPEPVVPLGHVIEAYDIAKLSGFEQISFAVNPQRK